MITSKLSRLVENRRIFFSRTVKSRLVEEMTRVNLVMEHLKTTNSPLSIYRMAMKSQKLDLDPVHKVLSSLVHLQYLGQEPMIAFN